MYSGSNWVLVGPQFSEGTLTGPTIETIVDCYREISGDTKNIVWDETKMNGDPIRCLSPDRQKKYGILPQTTLRDGIKHTILAYKERLGQ